MLSWRKRRKLAACAAMVAIAAPLACSIEPVTFQAEGVCLDGTVDPLEACDDGNTVDGDGCDGNCTPTGCGNGVATAGEGCDDGNADDTDACVAGCAAARCGDGFVRATVEACDDGGLVASDGCDPDCRESPIAYLKASNTGNDLFGWSIALSADGSTLAIGAHAEASAASGVDGDQANNAMPSAGAVYVFVRVGGAWRQQAYLKASNTGTSDQFGWSVALSRDGSTLAVGAFGEDSAASGVGGDQASDAATASGAVYVFTRSGTAWSQQAYLKASNTDAIDQFGWSVALSSDGSTLAVGAPLEDSAATGVGGDQANDSLPEAGAVYVLTRAGTVWSHQAYVKAPVPLSVNQFGYSVALSGDGATLATGALQENAVHVYTRTGAIWSPQSTLRALRANGGDYLGFRVALSEDGSTLAASALYEDSAATGVGGDAENNAAVDSGAAYVFTRTGGLWAQQAYIKATNTEANDYFGYGLALSRDGSSLAVGAYGEDSPATGVGGDQTLNSAPYAGAVYRYARSGATWSPQAYVKASNTETNDYFGISVALSGDGALLAASAYVEDGGATGAGGDQASNAVSQSGAVYVYR